MLREPRRVAVSQIACGVAHSLMLVQRDATVDALPAFTPVEVVVEEEEEAPAKGNGKAATKRKAPAAPVGGKKGKK